MRNIPFRLILFIVLFSAAFLSGLFPIPHHVAAQDAVATPTYDPLVEPPLPPNPTELELGQNLYWHWCMTCHGDRGQGLTDEFREIWEEDHQNCWARGCHAGRPGDLGFPIPTYVPGLVAESHLAQFLSPQGLADYLKVTHPPQSPGILKDEEYHAIALFVFTMNGRKADFIVSITAAPTLSPKSTATLPQPSTSNWSFSTVKVIAILLACGVVFVLLVVVSGKYFARRE